MQQVGKVHDRDLLDALEAHSPTILTVEAWRATWATREPLIGSASGGRWNPSGQFETLYTSMDKDGALAETYFHLSRQPVFSSCSMYIYRISVETKRTLTLSAKSLNELGIDEAGLRSPGYIRSQEIGGAAYMLEFDSLLIPSARSEHQNLVLFLDRINPEALRVMKKSDINWPSWKEGRTAAHGIV